ncbi:MAG: hypothetical protein FJX60_17885 [Alphaproteobacteria bacterium]|nr:hypothetical protein [Alphaproteobacteria bacterium]
MTRWISVLVVLGVFFAALPLDAVMAQQKVSPIYGGRTPDGAVVLKSAKTAKKPTSAAAAAKKSKPGKVRSSAQKAAQKKAPRIQVASA